MDKIKVLFVDDDVALGNIVTMALEDSGYEAYYQSSLIAIKSVIRELMPDIIVLDVEIGKKNGIDMTPELKMIAPEVPVLFVSSHVDSSEVVRALNAGGVAYLKKPFEIEELVAYISRHTVSFHVKPAQIGRFTLNSEDNLLMKGDEVVRKLSVFESKLLKLLMLNMNEVVTRQQIEQELWEDSYANEQSLNNYIAKLRKYLSDDESLELMTIPKVGYKLSQS